MTRNRFDTVLLIFVSMLLTVTVGIGGSMPVGALMGSKNVTIDGQVPLPHTTLLSGDSLQVRNGLAVVTLDQGNRMLLGRETEASFLRDADAVIISLSQGSLSLYHPQASRMFRVKAGEVTVAPMQDSQTLGELAMADGFLTVTAKDGTLQVEKAGATQKVTKGNTIKIEAIDERAAQEDQGGQRHLKNRKQLLLYIGLAAGAGLLAWAIVSATSGGGAPPTPVSPVNPGP